MTYILPYEKGIFIQDRENKYRISPPFFSLWNYRNLRKRSLIIGFVGARGSGKSVGAARTVILDYMLPGKTVWSNMAIEFNLVKNGEIVNIKSQPLNRLSLVDLDEVFRNGLIYLDEINLLMEARRAMSEENLMVSYILQQLRKRRLNLMWSAQSEMHCDDRLRFQTDIFVICQDVSINKPKCGIGELSLWKCHDYSGIVKGKVPNKSEAAIFYEGIQWNKPWWNTFDTEEIQEVAVASKEEEPDPLDEEATRVAGEIANYIVKNGADIDKDVVWQMWDIKDIRLRRRIGIKLSMEYGIIKRFNKYRLPEEVGV